MSVTALRTLGARLAGPLAMVASIVVFCLALWVIHRAVQDFSLSDVLAIAHETGWTDTLFALALTVLSFATLAGVDYLGTRWVKANVSFRRAAVTSFLSQAIAHTAGFAALTGTSIRYRLYTSAKVPPTDVARIVVFCAASFGIGTLLISALTAIFDPHRMASALSISPALSEVAGFLVVAMVATYVALSILRPSISLFGIRVAIPSGRFTLGQIGLSLIDLVTAAGALYVVLPDTGSLPFLEFVGVFVIAIGAGVVSHVPGGLGVFEGLLILFLPGIPPTEILAAILFYRLIYNLLPLILAAVLLAGFELGERAKTLKRAVSQLVGLAEEIVPTAFAVLALLGGLVLLASSATPAAPGRLELISDIIPLPVMELSHALGSIVGLFLVVLARGMYRRLESAWVVGIGLYIAGALFSLLKGWDYEEAILLTLLAFTLGISKPAFYRHTSLLTAPWGWGAITAGLVLGAAWLGWFSFHAQFYPGVSVVFGLAEEAPRTLRTTAALMAVAAGLLLIRITWPSPPRPPMPTPEEVEEAIAIIRASDRTEGQLLRLGDKHLFFSEDRSAFLMFGRSGRSLVSMGDPIGNPEAWRELIWSFREFCDRYGSWPSFYQVRADALPLYLDLGLRFIKLGEEAVVPLADFGLEGAARSELRCTHRRAVKDGASFEMLPPGLIEPPLCTELEAISNEWLETKGVREKSFSMGCFDPDYLRHFPLALVRRNGKIVAFANIWTTDSKEEATIDLMRQSGEAGYGTMDFLFVELMLWAKGEGYRNFSLGFAPLSGLADNPLAPVWTRMGAFIFRNGESFYNFKGLRRYKAKFNPIWRPRFLAAPGGTAVPQVMLDVATLISSGVRGLVGK